MATKPVHRQLDLAQQGRDITLPNRSLVNGVLSFSSVLSLPNRAGPDCSAARRRGGRQPEDEGHAPLGS